MSITSHMTKFLFFCLLNTVCSVDVRTSPLFGVQPATHAEEAPKVCPKWINTKQRKVLKPCDEQNDDSSEEQKTQKCGKIMCSHPGKNATEYAIGCVSEGFCLTASKAECFSHTHNSKSKMESCSLFEPKVLSKSPKETTKFKSLTAKASTPAQKLTPSVVAKVTAKQPLRANVTTEKPKPPLPARPTTPAGGAGSSATTTTSNFGNKLLYLIVLAAPLLAVVLFQN